MPKPELVLIQIMDADIACPATKRDYAAFRSTFLSALKVLALNGTAALVLAELAFARWSKVREAANMPQH